MPPPPDLEIDLGKAAGVDPAKVMDSFLDIRPAFPLIHSNVRCEPDATPRIEIAPIGARRIPGRFPCAGRRTGSRTAKPAPCWTRHGEGNRAAGAGAACPVPGPILNAGGTGYYRTEWTEAQVTALADHGLAGLTSARRLNAYSTIYRALLQAGRMDAFPLFLKLAADPEPEIAKVASDTLQGK